MTKALGALVSTHALYGSNGRTIRILLSIISIKTIGIAYTCTPESEANGRNIVGWNDTQEYKDSDIDTFMDKSIQLAIKEYDILNTFRFSVNIDKIVEKIPQSFKNKK